MAHRIREGMRSGSLAPFGGNGTAVEADETFIGREPGRKKARAFWHKIKVLSLIDRETGAARSVVIDDLRPSTIGPILSANIAKEATLMTDQADVYRHLAGGFAKHESVNHTVDEYVRLSDRTIHSNTVEGFFSIFKRGMKGVYQHASKKHLHRYLAEFDFRFSNREALGVNDKARAATAVAGVVGKRLTYKRSHVGAPVGA